MSDAVIVMKIKNGFLIMDKDEYDTAFFDNASVCINDNEVGSIVLNVFNQIKDHQEQLSEQTKLIQMDDSTVVSVIEASASEGIKED